MEAKTLFDIGTKQPDRFVLLISLTLFLFGVAAIWMEKKKIGIIKIRRIGYALSGLGVLTASYSWATWTAKKRDGSRALQAGQRSVVEGPVSNFHPMPFAGHSLESFTIENQRFSYSDFVVTPCFNNTSSHGGPIHDGLYLRVYYIDDCILRIDSLPGARAHP